MGKVHQIGDAYYIEFTARGLIYQQKAGKDLLKAQKLLHSIEEKINNGETLTLSRQIDLDVFFKEFLKYARSQYHPNTIRRLKSTVDHFLEFIQSHCPDVVQLSQVTPRVIEDYKAYGIQMRQAKQTLFNPKIINLTMLLLREILEYGIKSGFINDNPTLHISLLGVTPGASDVLSDEDCARILEEISEPYQDMFRFMRFTGLRPMELTSLTWQGVDLNRQVIFVRLREVPLMMGAFKILQSLSAKIIDYKAPVFQHPGGGVIDVWHLNKLFVNASRTAGLGTHLSVGHLRKIFIRKLLERSVPMLSIARMSGISDVAKLMLFVQYMPLTRLDNGV